MAITNVPFIIKNRHFYRLKNFALLRLCAKKLFIGIEWIGSMVLSCQRCRGVKIASRKGAKSQRRKVAKEDGTHGRMVCAHWILNAEAARGPLETRTLNIDRRTLPRLAVLCQLGLRQVAKLANARSAFNIEPKRSRRERWAIQAVIFASYVGRSMLDVRRSYSFFQRDVLNAERALASLEETGEAQTGMAGGNFEFWIGRELRAGARAGRFVFHSKSIIQNSTLHGGRRQCSTFVFPSVRMQ